MRVQFAIPGGGEDLGTRLLVHGRYIANVKFASHHSVTTTMMMTVINKLTFRAVVATESRWLDHQNKSIGNTVSN